MKAFLEDFFNNYSIKDDSVFEGINKERFNQDITLFDYQLEAVEKITKIADLLSHLDFDIQNYNDYLRQEIENNGIKLNELNVKKSKTIKSLERFDLLSNYFEVSDKEVISAQNFLNRAAFWMATGSGKSLVLIKIIEYIDYLIQNDRMPNKDMLLLVPNENILTQFKELIKEYNIYSNKNINFIRLDRYSENKKEPSIFNDINLYYYRTDLLRDNKAESIIDFKDYENNGNWYIFLDEAHKGQTGNSWVQDYISIMVRNGFLFNFSATFTDYIDYLTTIYNFNLEKFISSGYGKNIFLPPSSFKFKKDKNEFEEREKLLQVLKSLITLTFVKKSRKNNYYHSPLMIVLVNSVNTESSDLQMFFKELEKLAIGKIDETLLLDAKNELYKDIKNGGYIFSCQDFSIENSIYREEVFNITYDDILQNIFNAKSNGKIELIEGESGKEIALKLTTSDRPFSLIKIGDTDKFKREKLGENYISYKTLAQSSYFSKINEETNGINILLGSRSFYEGWDSNRPNVMQFINIGGSEAKKFVLQALGRGIRIEPNKGNRKRLDKTNASKNLLLETLFIYSTDHKGVKSVLDTLQNEKEESNSINISSNFTEGQQIFPLYIPTYKSIKNIDAQSKFSIDRDTLQSLRIYFNEVPANTFLVRFKSTLEEYNYLQTMINDDSFFMLNSEKKYNNMRVLVNELISFIKSDKEILGKIQKVNNEIVHFKEIRTIGLSNDAVESLTHKIRDAKNFTTSLKKKLVHKLANGDISNREYIDKTQFTFQDYELINISNHLYIPILFSHNEKQNYIKNIVQERSEVKFLQNLSEWLDKNEKNLKKEWMFSVIIENVDSIYIPYFDPDKNRYRRFYPDFIFWINEGDDYKIYLIDPKGTSHIDYLFKIKGYEEIFMEKNSPRIYSHKNKKISVSLRLVTDNLNNVPKEFQKYWIETNNFKFLES